MTHIFIYLFYLFQFQKNFLNFFFCFLVICCLQLMEFLNHKTLIIRCFIVFCGGRKIATQEPSWREKLYKTIAYINGPSNSFQNIASCLWRFFFRFLQSVFTKNRAKQICRRTTTLYEFNERMVSFSENGYNENSNWMTDVGSETEVVVVRILDHISFLFVFLKDILIICFSTLAQLTNDEWRWSYPSQA